MKGFASVGNHVLTAPFARTAIEAEDASHGSADRTTFGLALTHIPCCDVAPPRPTTIGIVLLL